MDVPGQKERIKFSFLCLCILVGLSADGMMPTYMGVDRSSLLSSLGGLKSSFFQKHPHRHIQEECFTSYLGIIETSKVDI
jgi:hypothetical protein